MPKPFDHTLKILIETWPGDWLRLLGLPADGTIEAIDTELPAMAVQSDRMFRVHGGQEYIAHLELQSNADGGLPDRSFLYNTLSYRREGLPVVTSVVLLRPKADGPFMTGVVERHDPLGHCYLRFEYRVIRLWQIPVETILAGGPGIWPLAPLAQGAESNLASVVSDFQRRVETLPAARQSELLTAGFILTGLLNEPEVGAALFRKVRTMKESTTYQEIVAEGEGKGRAEGRVEGRVEALQEVLLELAAREFGPPSQTIQNAVRSLRSEEQLRSLLLDVAARSSWDELLSSGTRHRAP